jgi:triacylglycerol lipase
VDDTDIITKLPPNGFNFVHVGTEKRIRAGITNYILEWLKNPLAPPKPLADHAPVNYVDRI